jgi:hypothetical protein
MLRIPEFMPDEYSTEMRAGKMLYHVNKQQPVTCFQSCPIWLSASRAG